MMFQDHPFYRPLWRRVVINGVTASWVGMELYFKAEPVWTMLAVGFLAYTAWFMLITYPKQPPQN
jgi:hypothetical protein